MLIKAKTLKGYQLYGNDGEFGKVKEFFFDDQHWAIRYLVADTGNWLTGKQVLISPYALSSVNKKEEYISVNLNKQQIEDSPSLDYDMPVSRQYENSYYGYYGYPTYWSGTYMWGAYPKLSRERKDWIAANLNDNTGDPHLHSTKDVKGHAIQATDGDIGHVQDFIIDDEMWAIRYIIIDTQNWWPGKSVLVSPKWIDRVSWNDQSVFVNLTRESIKQSPEYTDDTLLTRDYETNLHSYYNRTTYWSEEPADRNLSF